MNANNFTPAGTALESLWQLPGLPQDQLQHTHLTGTSAVCASSFAVTTAAQASIAAAASGACLIAKHRSSDTHTVTVNSLNAVLECTSHFSINGSTPAQWADYSGLYQTADGYLRVHANFDHHRDCLFTALGIPTLTDRKIVEAQVKKHTTHELDTSITELGGACAALRTFNEWDDHPQAQAINNLPLIEITRTDNASPRTLPAMGSSAGALNGIKVLDLTRILAGPVCGRTLAAYGAEVMLVNSPNLPNIESIIDTSRGKLSAHIDLQNKTGADTLHALLKNAQVFIQGYRPNALGKLGFDAQTLCKRYPGLVTVSLSAYGREGPWHEKRGFDSLVQTATGFNAAEAKAFGIQTPKPLPVQILDYASGFLMAFGAQAALYKQLTEGGSYHVQVSLARTAQWLRKLGQSNEYLTTVLPDPTEYLQHYASEYGDLMALPHAAVFTKLPNRYKRPSAPPGTHPAVWTG